MAEQTKERSMTTDTTSKISENPKKKKQIQCPHEGKRSKKESDLQLPFTASRERNGDLRDYHFNKHKPQHKTSGNNLFKMGNLTGKSNINSCKYFGNKLSFF